LDLIDKKYNCGNPQQDMFWSNKPLVLDCQGKHLKIKLLGFEIPLGSTIKNLCFIDLFGIAISI